MSTKFSRDLTVAGPNPVWIERIPLIGFPNGVVVREPGYFAPGKWRVDIDEQTHTATITPAQEATA